MGGDEVQAQLNAGALARNVKITNLAEVREFEVDQKLESDAGSDQAVAGIFEDAQSQDEAKEKVRSIIDAATSSHNSSDTWDWNGANDGDIS